MSELLAIGGTYVDINCPDFPIDDSGLQSDTETVGGTYILDAGGSAPNFARLCSSLDLPTTFIGKVGQDAMGNLFSSLLREAGVEPALVVDPDVQTNIGVNFIKPDGTSIMTVAGDSNQSLTAAEVIEKADPLLDTVSYLCISGCFKLKTLLPAFTELMQLAKARGVRVALDHGRVNADATPKEIEHVKALALEADYYFPSRDEFLKLWSVDSIEQGFDYIGRHANGITVLKDSTDGAHSLINGTMVTVPAFDVDPLHTVGAGDSFNAGFIAAQYHGMDVLQSMRFGCATAALKISRPDLPTMQTVQKMTHE